MFEVTSLSPALGAEIRGIDLRKTLSDDEVDFVRSTLHDRVVIAFPDQPELTKDELKQFAKRFGTIIPSTVGRSGEDPELFVIDSVSAAMKADIWHADDTLLEAPPMGTVLRAHQLPAVGGDTCFASMYAAYDALSPAMREFLDGLTAVHSVARRIARIQARGGDIKSMVPDGLEPVVHPVVVVHPRSRRKVLYVNASKTDYIVELSPVESEALLRMLYAHLTAPEFQVRIKWRPNTVVFWDNCAAQHYAVADYVERRIMHRVTLEGQHLDGVAALANTATAAG